MSAKNNTDFDIIIVGCGVAGTAAALSAAEVLGQGSSVLVLERLPEKLRGGNSRYTGAFLRMEDEQRVAPRFVEDIVRIIANGLLQDEKITWFAVKSINYESIHNHNAYAFITRDKRL